MKIIVAPDSFKGSLTAAQACIAIVKGIRRVVPGAQIVSIPMADGGEGTVDALVTATGGRTRDATVTGPLGEQINAVYGILGQPQGASGQTAVIEMAAAAGLTLVPADKRNPLHTTTYGVGQLILDAFGHGCRDFIIGIGGSATNDCGTGMVQALGVRFFDSNAREITTPMTGELMGRVVSLDCQGFHPGLAQCSFVIACDVTNPLLGPQGASYVYARQKGADDETIRVLEANMTNIIDLIEAELSRRIRDIPGTGAAGGTGTALLGFLGAKFDRGVDLVMSYSGFAEKIRSADLIITGEGQIDGTTVSGKTVAGIAAAAERHGGGAIPVIVLAGSLGPQANKVLELPAVTALLSICRGPVSLESAMHQGAELLADTAEQALRLALIQIRHS